MEIERECQFCGNKTEMPFECNYCKDFFCQEHRLPEDHRCIKLSQIRAQRFGQKKVVRNGNTGKGNPFKKVLGKFKKQ